MARMTSAYTTMRVSREARDMLITLAKKKARPSVVKFWIWPNVENASCAGLKSAKRMTDCVMMHPRGRATKLKLICSTR